jgi:hypothetical protein
MRKWKTMMDRSLLPHLLCLKCPSDSAVDNRNELGFPGHFLFFDILGLLASLTVKSLDFGLSSH